VLPDPLGKSPLLHRWDGSNAIATQKTNISSSLFHYVPRMARSAASQPLLLAGPLDAGPRRAPAIRGALGIQSSTPAFVVEAAVCQGLHKHNKATDQTQHKLPQYPLTCTEATYKTCYDTHTRHGPSTLSILTPQLTSYRSWGVSPWACRVLWHVVVPAACSACG